MRDKRYTQRKGLIIMMNDQTRLEFAIRFAQTDLSSFREGDWLNLFDDVLEFLRGIPAVIPMKGKKALLDRADAEALKNEIYALLKEIVNIRDGKYESEPHPIAFNLIVMPPLTGPRKVVFFTEGSTRDLFLLRTALLLFQQPTDKVLRCHASDCDRIFLRKRKQRYCSPRCQTRDFMRVWRKDNEEKNSDLNHRKYKAHVNKLRGRPTRVARKPRRKIRAGN
jgi:hypothetical protein